jgi:hypothetical protein
MLPFKSETEPKPETYTIDDGHGTKLDVAKFGYLIVDEAIAFEKAAKEHLGSTNAEFKTAVVNTVLSIRFGQDPSENNLGGDCSFKFVEEAYEFIANERSQWKKSEPQEGKEGKSQPGAKSTGD